MLDAKPLLFQFLCGAGFLAAALLAGCAGSGSPLEAFDQDLPRPHDYPIHGIDVSKFQGDIDWSAVANSGVKFAWIKATEGGDHADDRFQANWTGAKAAGVPHGAYHFVYWCRPPLEEMAFFEQNAPVEDDALPPVLDVEATPTSRTCHKHLTQESAIADMRVMLQEMERHYGKRPVIYTTVDFYAAILSDGAFMDYPIWVRSTKHNPVVKYGSRPWHFWQYQSDGRVSGIGAKVDRDVFHGTPEQWQAFLSGQTPRAQPPQQSAQPQTVAVQPASERVEHEPVAQQTVEQEPAAQSAAEQTQEPDAQQ
jgi:lysozyme